jgi:glutamate racemase
MQNLSAHPIGIFDSGIGGLTVAHAVTQQLPQESIIYFGDTAHAPWGDKSTAAIQAYSIKICDMLLQQHCKVILMACNTASAAAYELVKEYIGQKAMVFNVIDPVINYLREHYHSKCIGLIGTHQTIQSNTYRKKIDALHTDLTLKALATPLLVPLIEEGFSEHKIMADILKNYLANPELEGIEALILGCTHYPLIKKSIEAFYQHKIPVIDSSKVVAKALKGFLEYHDLCNKTVDTNKRFFVSDYTEPFAACAKVFFQDEVLLERYPLWE